MLDTAPMTKYSSNKLLNDYYAVNVYHDDHDDYDKLRYLYQKCVTQTWHGSDAFTHVEFNKKSYKCKLMPLFLFFFTSNFSSQILLSSLLEPSSQIPSTLLSSLYLFGLSFKRLFQLFNDFKQEKSWVRIIIWWKC